MHESEWQSTTALPAQPAELAARASSIQSVEHRLVGVGSCG